MSLLVWLLGFAYVCIFSCEHVLNAVCCALLRCQGFAYVEFLEADAVEAAVLLNDSELRGRQIKVCLLFGI
jgi:RNA recognition motif-containing protein